MSTNIRTCNNLVISGTLTTSNNIISNGNLQTNNITSQNINNSNSISTNSINSNTGSLTNLSVSNILTLLSSSTPIIFNYNGNNYNLTTLMLFTLQQLGGASIASQSYVNTQISNLVNSSPDSLNVLSELAAAINNDASFSTTITNLIATKVSLTSNNTISGSNTFNSSSGNIIDRLFSTIISINNGNTRRNVNNYFEVGMGQTSSYIYYDNTGKFGSVNTIDSNLNWNIALNSVFTINTINSVNENISGTGIVNNLYSNILVINNNNLRRSTNDILEVATSSTGNYLYYNNSSVFGHINTSNSASSWSINSSGLASFPSLTSGVSSISSLSVNSSSVRGTGDLITVSVTPTGNYIYLNNGGVLGGYNTIGAPSNFPWTINMEGLGTFRNISSLAGSITNLYSNILSINNGMSLRSANDLLNVSISSTGNYLYYNNSSTFGNINTSNSNNSWLINSSGNAQFPLLNTPSATVTTLNSTTGIISNLYSNILAINNNNVQRATNDIFEVCTSSSTGNYLYYNNTSVFGHINTSNSASSWFINSSGSATFPSLNVSGVSSTSTLAVGSSSVRGSGDLLTVSVTPSGDYLYLNNGGALGIYKSDGNPSFPWLIDVNGNARFRAFRSNNALNCYPNIITSVTSNKTLGLTDITVTTIILEPFYDNTITISSPISLYRQYRNNSANSQLFNRLYDTLNSVSYTILKNGSTFTSGTCSTNNTLNREIYVTTDSTTSSTYHEIYIANAECSFTPSISSTSDTYIVNYTVSYSQTLSWQSYNLIIESFGYNVNTDVSGRSGNIQGGTNCNYWSIF